MPAPFPFACADPCREVNRKAANGSQAKARHDTKINAHEVHYDLGAALNRHTEVLLARTEEILERHQRATLGALARLQTSTVPEESRQSKERYPLDRFMVEERSWPAKPHSVASGAHSAGGQAEKPSVHMESTTTIGHESNNAETQTDHISLVANQSFFGAPPEERMNLERSSSETVEHLMRQTQLCNYQPDLEEKRRKEVLRRKDVEANPRRSLSGTVAARAFVEAEHKIHEHRNPNESWFARAVAHERFDMVCGCAIVANALVICAQLEYNGMRSGAMLGLNSFEESGWLAATRIFKAFDMMFCIMFSAELLTRIAALRTAYFCQAANWLDVFVVSASVLEQALEALKSTRSLPDLTFARLLRMVKLIRALRMVRVMRLFHHLRLLALAIASSVGALVWSMFFLVIVQGIAAILMTQVTGSFLLDPAVPDEIRAQVYQYFGRTTLSMLTMYQITMAPGPWAPIGRLMIFDVSGYFALFFVPYGWMVTFAVVRVISALFLKQTVAAAAGDGEVAVLERMQRWDREFLKLHSIFSTGDLDSSGHIDLQEFRTVLGNPMVKSWISLLDLDVTDLNRLFLLLDDGDGSISFDEFISGVMRCRGAARSVDILAMLSQSKHVLEQLGEVVKVVKGETFNGANDALDALPKHRDSTQPNDERAVSRMSQMAPMVHADVGPDELDPHWKLIVKSKKFDFAAGILIAASAIHMAVELELQGLVVGVKIGEVHPEDGDWGSMATVLLVLDIGFSLAFTAELVARIAAFGKAFFKTKMNWVDVITVIVPIIEVALLQPVAISASSDSNSRPVRMVRLLRLVKVARILRVMTLFHQLRILVSSIVETVGTLGWAIVLMGIVQLISAIFMTQAIAAFLSDPSGNEDLRSEVHAYFGTWSLAMLTLHEMTLAPAAWGYIGRKLIFEVYAGYVVFFLVYGVLASFAMVNVISAIFLKETLAAAAGDSEIAIMERVSKRKKEKRLLQGIFTEGDHDGSGGVDWEEFQVLMDNPRAKAWLSVLDLDVTDMVTVFTLLDEGDGVIDFDEFIHGVMRCRGSARGVDVVALMAEFRKIRHQVAVVTQSVFGGRKPDANYVNIAAKDV